MSESILKALMQLFAIIAPPESNAKERRTVVGSFLKQQLNQELVEEYLKVFDVFYDEFQKRQSVKKRRNKSIAVSSVKILKICTQINEELTQKQKIIVLVRLLEFIKSDFEEITEQELEFVYTVADTFYISSEEYNRIKAFVLYKFDQVPNSSKVLFIDNNENHDHPKVKHILRKSLSGQIRIFSVDKTNMYLVRYLGENELFLNGQIVHKDKVYVFTQGTAIRGKKINPVYYSDIVSIFKLNNDDIKILYEVNKIEYHFKGGGIGLHEMTFSGESGKLIGLMGASGAGKTTLLNVLNGSNEPTKGQVLINGIDIFKEKDKIHGLIGNVSQDDLLIEELTVFQNLYYNAKLCFGGLSEFQILRKVLRTLQNLGLYEKKDMIVGSPLNKKISGGQRKRLNIGLELIREPAVLFLDEPTSGLSSRDSENILDLLKELTLKGKLIFVVIHQPSSDIFKMFDKMLILDTGGYLIYDGNPVDSIIYFKSKTHQANWSESECRVCGNVNPELVFNIVETHVLDEYGNLTHTRKISPPEWRKEFLDYKVEKIKKSDDEKIEENKKYHTKKLPKINFKIPSKFKQFKVFVIRDVLAKLSNKQYLFINLLEAPLLAFFLAYLIRYYNVDISNEYGYTFGDNSNVPVYLFMAVIVAIFIGLTVSAEEIIKDQLILKREKFLNLSWGSYLFSKVGILLVISAIQALLFVAIGNFVIDIKGMYWQYWLVLFTIWSISSMFGLNISNSFKTSVTIYILIPFLVIPNIILSGIIVKYDKLNPDLSSPSGIPFYGEIIPARWAYEALAVYQFKENKFEKQFYPYDKITSISTFKKDYWLKELKQKLTQSKKELKSEKPDKEILKNNIELFKNEITKENNINKKVKFKYINLLNIDKFNLKTIKKIDDYFRLINQYYIKKNNKALNKKDEIISKLQKNETERKKFKKLKKDYFNESLKDFVKNDNDLNRIVDYNNTLIQKIDPIFLDPSSNFVKAHFYAPRKKLFGVFIDTFWMNILVLWFGTIILFITLYFKLLKRFLDYLENLSDNIKRKKNK